VLFVPCAQIIGMPSAHNYPPPIGSLMWLLLALQVLNQARQFNVPKDILERNIKRASDAKQVGLRLQGGRAGAMVHFIGATWRGGITVYGYTRPATVPTHSVTTSVHRS
jgi:hypothetical protein